MRDFAKVSPSLWTGATGKELRGRGSEALVVALYLMSSPHSNMLGLYYQPVLYMAHETGLGIEGASKGLRDCIEAGFCRFDEASEMVWVVEMATYQIGDALKATDKRCAGIQKEYDALPNCPFLEAFFDHYEEAFHMKRKRSNPPPTDPSEQAPSKPHRSKEKEKEKEKERKNEGASVGPTAKLDLVFTLPDWIPADAWSGYASMRVKTRKPMTDRARDLVIAALRQFHDQGHDVGEILDRSTKNNWTDVYAPKANEARQLETVNRI